MGVGLALAVGQSSGGVAPTTTTAPPPTTTIPAGDSETFASASAETASPGENFTLDFQVIGDDPINGTVTASLYGPGDTTCASPPAYSEDVAVTASGAAYSTAPTSVPGNGIYRWVASYGGNGGNNPSATECEQEGTTIFVSSQLTVLEMRVVPRKFTPSDKNQPPGPAFPFSKGNSNFPARIELTTNYDGIIHFAFRRSTSKPAPSNGTVNRGFNAEIESNGDQVPITGKVGGKKLKPGKYVVKARTVSNTGYRGDPVSAPFRIPLP